MPDATPEAVMRAACEAILKGDFMTAMAELTSEAMSDAMTLAGGFSNAPLPESYAIESHQETDGDHRYAVVFKAGVHEMHASATWRLIADAWKIVGLSIESVT